MSYSNRNVLVTGADGFIGSHLTEALISRGARVTALCAYNSFDTIGWLDDLSIEARETVTVRRGDIRDASFVRRLVQDQQIIFHLAALIAIPQSYHAPQSYVDTNILGTLNVLEAARDARVERIVHTSTSEVYGTAISVPISEGHPLQGQSPYSASKIAADMMAEAFGRCFDLPVVILRPFNTFGPRQSERAVIPSLIRQALDPACATIMIGDMTTVRDLSYVSDTAAAFLDLGAAPSVEFGSPYNAGTGRAIAIGELASLVLSLTECRKLLVEDQDRLRPARSEVRALLADNSRLRLATGWKPRVSFEVGLAQTVAWWRDRLGRGLVRRDYNFIV